MGKKGSCHLKAFSHVNTMLEGLISLILLLYMHRFSTWSRRIGGTQHSFHLWKQIGGGIGARLSTTVLFWALLFFGGGGSFGNNNNERNRNIRWGMGIRWFLLLKRYSDITVQPDSHSLLSAVNGMGNAIPFKKQTLFSLTVILWIDLDQSWWQVCSCIFL